MQQNSGETGPGNVEIHHQFGEMSGGIPGSAISSSIKNSGSRQLLHGVPSNQSLPLASQNPGMFASGMLDIGGLSSSNTGNVGDLLQLIE